MQNATNVINFSPSFYLEESRFLSGKAYNSESSVFVVTTVKWPRAGGAGPTTPTLVGPKILLFMVIALYFQSSGRTNNCQIEVLFKWSDQSCTLSAALVMLYAFYFQGIGSNKHYLFITDVFVKYLFFAGLLYTEMDHRCLL